MEDKTLKGIVSWFNPKLGYGFILREDNKPDIFVFYSDINMEGYRTLLPGDKVTFEEDFSYKGKVKAANVVLIERTKK